MATLKWKTVWDNHPYPVSPCDTGLFGNQCAIRMGVALAKSGVNLASFTGARCWSNLKHSPKHILRAQELADWLAKQKAIVGKASKRKKVTSADYIGKTGIVFFKDGWASGGDHIDVWDGHALKAGRPEYFALGKEIWFWALS